MRTAALLVLAVGGLSPFSAYRAFGASTTYLSNLSEPVFNGIAVGSDRWIAQSFSTGNFVAGYNFDSVQIIADTSGTPAGSFQVFLYNDAGGVPGTSLGQLAGPNPAGFGTYTYLAAGLSLSPATAYWVVITQTQTIEPPPYYFWELPSTINFNATGGWYHNPGGTSPAFSPNGLTWNTNASGPFFFALNAAPLACTPPPANMISWWPGDGNGNDIQSGNNLTFTNGETYGPGKVDQAFSFNGSNSASAGNPSNLNLTGDQVTIDGWINPSVDLTTESWFFGKSGDGTTRYAIEWESGFLLGRANTSGVEAVFTPPTNAWTHVAVVYNGNANPTTTLYVNGTVLVSGNPSSGNLSATSAPFVIGAFGDGTRNFNGLVDEVEVFDRALSAEEIRAIYLADSFGKCHSCATPPKGLVSWLPGDGNFRDIQDGNDGIPGGGVSFTGGEVGQAFQFDGTSGYVSLGNPPNLNFNSAFSVDAWVRPDVDNHFAPNFRTIISKWSQSGNASWGVFMTNYSICAFVINNSGGSTGACSGPIPFGPNAPFTHVAVTYGASSELRVYLNGTLAASAGGISNLRIGSDNVQLGNDTDFVGDRWFPGAIDEVELFNVELTATDIQKIYDAGSLGKCRTCAPAPAGMLSWWPGNGNAEDVQGSFDGALQNGTTFAPGKVDQAFNFDGSDDYVDIGDNLDMGTSDFTIDVWIKGDPSMQDWGRIIDKGYATGYALGKRGSENKVAFEFLASGSQGNNFKTVTDVIDNTWHHIAVVKAGNTARLYVDGVLENTETVSTDSQDNDLALVLGVEAGEAMIPAHWKGQIDELEIFGRALSAEEIAAIADAGTAGKCPCVDPPTGMVAWWPFDGNLFDIQGAHTGTGNGGGPSFVSGEVSQAANFDGVDDSVSAPDSTDWNFGTGEFSFDFWARSTTTTRMHAISFDPEPNVRNLDFDFNDTYGLWVYWNSGGGVNGVDAIQVGSPGDYTDGQWHHFALSRSGSNWTLYIDGVVGGTAKYPGALDLSGGNTNFIGRHGFFDTEFYWNGQIDEVEIFKNHALSATEVAAIYNAAGAGKCKPSDADHDGDPDFLDCDDTNPEINHGGIETCNGLDDNCDGQIDEGFPSNTFYRDADGDGYGNQNVTIQACAAPPGYVADNADCDDTNGSVHPGATEVCNGVDDNCDGTVDEGCPTPTPTPTPTATPTATPTPTPASTPCTTMEVYVSPSAASVSEGSDRTFTVSVTHGPAPCPITVYYSKSGSAGYNSDFTLTQPLGQVTIPAGQSSATVTFHANTDGLREGKESATFTLTNGPGYRVTNIKSKKKTTFNIPKNRT